MDNYIQVISTVDNEDTAKRIAGRLLEERAVACVQILGPVTSFFWWKGEIQESREWVCLAKGKKEDYDKIEATIKSTHPYDIPEILAIPVLSGNTAYLSWISAETTANTRPQRTLRDAKPATKMI
ncbi:MAG: divalent-cation tolerance protein CutA [archaeon]